MQQYASLFRRLRPGSGRSSPARLALAVAVALATLSVACASPAPAADHAAAERGYRGVMLPAPVEKPATVLTTTSGEPYDLRERTHGQVTLLFFGYANCPDVCPVHMANIATVLQRMPYDQVQRVTVVFVTVDPERDTPEKLRPWLDRFDPRFVALTGDTATLNAAQRELGVSPAVREEVGGASGYAMAHAAQVYAFTRDGLAHIVYPFGTRQADWAHDLPRLVEEGWGATPAASSRSGSTPDGSTPAVEGGGTGAVVTGGGR